MIATNAYGSPASGWIGTLAGIMTGMPKSRTCAVRLIDRRTGRPHRINGAPLVVYTRQPHLAVAELLRGRDPALWEARIEPLGTEVSP